MLLLSYLLLVCFSWSGTGKVHDRSLHGDWTCDGCAESKDDRMHIFGAITTSIRIGFKNAYYPFNVDWFNRIGKPGSKVHLKYVYIDDLNTVDANDGLRDYQKTKERARNKEKDVNTESVLIEETIRVFVAHMRDPTDYNEKRQASIDDFLTMNPCLIPLHEPNIEESWTNSSNFVEESPLHSRLLNRVVVMVQLPILGFGPTCSFYAHLVRHQFPAKCPSGVNKSDIDNNYRVHVLSNAGYGGALITMLEQVLYNFVQTPEKIFVVPSGDHDDNTWIWNAREKCSIKTNSMDTWRCNFLPLSNCTYLVVDEKQAMKTKTERSKLEYLDEPVKKSIKFLKLISGDDEEFSRDNLLFHNDGYDTQDGIVNWLRYRLFAFIQRPNAKFRALLRAQLKNVYMLGNPAKSIDQNVYQHHVRHVDELVDCVGMHVRNGDVWIDGRGPIGSIVDRSFNAHVYVARNISLELGVQTIYLATDNASLASIAPVIYPEYKWIMLKRRIADYWRGKREVHIHEKNAQIELANIFADVIGISKCSALVGAFDSSFTRVIHLSMCNHNIAGICPPEDSVLREDLRGDDLPFAGAYSPPPSFNWGGLAMDVGKACEDCRVKSAGVNASKATADDGVVGT